MMKFLKQFHHNWLISIILWVIVIFFAVFKLPNVGSLIENNGQPVFNKSSQLTQAAKMQQDWGRSLAGTNRVSMVYHSDKPITTKQQKSINSAVNQIEKSAKHFSIKRITDINSNPNGKLQLISKDKTTEIVNLYLGSNNAVNQNVMSDIQNIMEVSGLDNNATSVEMLNQINNRQIAKTTRSITIIALILSMVIIGLLFRSILAPIISIISLIISYFTSLSIITNLVIHNHFPFFVYTPLITLLVTLILGTIFNFLIYHRTMEYASQYRGDDTPVKQAIDDYAIQTLTSYCILALIFVCFYFIKFNVFRNLLSVTITIGVLALINFTLTPALLHLTGNKLIWPKKVIEPISGHKMWNKLTRFSLWQPFAGLLVVLYIAGPLIYSYNNSLSFNNQQLSNSTDQAAVGARTLQAHFNPGKSTPVTIYLKSDKSLDNEKSLQQIDALTSKLKSMSGVNSVYSVTQPSGIPIGKYYIYTQLNDVNTQINRVQKQIYSISKDAKKGKNNLNLSELDKQIAHLKRAKSTTDSLINNNSEVKSQISQAASNASSSVINSNNQNVKAYKLRLNELSQELDNAVSNMNQLGTQTQNANSYASTVSDNLGTYKEQLQAVKTSLSNVNAKAKNVNSSLNNVYNYLEGLAHSSAANVYYITNNQITDTDFQQSLFNYTSQNMKMTQIEVVLSGTPDSSSNSANVAQLKDEINVQLQGTTLQNAQVVTSGQPEQQAELKRQFNKSIKIAIVIIALISLIALFWISRAILQPIYWSLVFVGSAVSGLQLTSILMKMVTGNGNLSWQSSLILLALLTAIGVWQLVPIAISFRERGNSITDWLEPSLTQLGQTIKYLWIIVIAIALSVFFHATLPTMTIGFAIIITIIIFNLMLPIMITALGKLSETIPEFSFKSFRKNHRKKNKH